MTKRKEVGHTFKAWCGPTYRFILNDKGKLTIRPRVDYFLTEYWKDLEWATNRYLDVEAGLREALAAEDLFTSETPEMRRALKSRLFTKVYYAGLEDHGWRDRMPPGDGTITGRMTIHHPPLEF